MSEAGPWSLSWRHGSLSVQSMGGMIGPLTLRNRLGRDLDLFAIAPWAQESSPEIDAAPGHLRRLRGAFPCLPFGMGASPKEVDQAWRGLPFVDEAEPPHGHCANEPWRLVAATPETLSLEHLYPESHAVETIRQLVEVDPDAAALSVTISVVARRKVRLPFGMHFILRLDEDLALEPPRFASGWTYPARLEPGCVLTRSGASFKRLDDVPAHGGGSVDLTTPRLDRPFEDVVQVCGLEGPMVARFGRDGRLEIDWDRETLPSCLLWYSHRGIQGAPWRGRFVGLGVEPIAAAFDFSAAVSTGLNPIASQGVATAIGFDPDQPWSTQFRLALLD